MRNNLPKLLRQFLTYDASRLQVYKYVVHQLYTPDARFQCEPLVQQVSNHCMQLPLMHSHRMLLLDTSCRDGGYVRRSDEAA